MEIMNAKDQMILDMLGSDSKVMGEAEAIKSEGGKATAGQLKFYADLCIQKQVAINEALVTADEVSAQIKHLMTLKTFKPLSEKQIEVITKYCTELNMPLPDFSKLSGAYEGSGSQFIGRLIELSKNKVKPASEQQVKFIMQMSVCPDCEDITDTLDKMDSKAASEFITANRQKYFDWKNTRLSEAQMNLIVTLTERTGGEPLSPTQIIQFDKETASKFINQLQKELADRSLTETTLEPEYNMELSKDAVQDLTDLCHRLYASIGQEVESDFIETLDFAKLKDLVQLIKFYPEIPVGEILESSNLFTSDQIVALTI